MYVLSMNRRLYKLGSPTLDRMPTEDPHTALLVNPVAVVVVYTRLRWPVGAFLSAFEPQILDWPLERW
jgi:hypothetical protein